MSLVLFVLINKNNKETTSPSNNEVDANSVSKEENKALTSYESNEVLVEFDDVDDSFEKSNKEAETEEQENLEVNNNSGSGNQEMERDPDETPVIQD